MIRPTFQPSDIRARLQAAVAAAGTAEAYARAHGLTPRTVRRVLSGERDEAPGAVLAAMGLARVRVVVTVGRETTA